jgi:hypothetical protein
MSSFRPSPSRYGDALQSVVAGKRTTVVVPREVLIVHRTTYEAYPPEGEFELDDYNSYKTLRKQKELI